MEPFIIGGHFADIYRFPHSVFLSVDCVISKDDIKSYWACGGSILNHIFVLTAAHCVSHCGPATHITAIVGHEDNSKGSASSVQSHYIHTEYREDIFISDIALLQLKTYLSFNSNVKRVAIVQNPPYNETAMIAGWGIVDENINKATNILKYVEQVIRPTSYCRMALGSLPRGTFCASHPNSSVDYPSRGDSGSALLVREYIQVGFVSYKIPSKSKSLLVYTDISYYYDWIKRATKEIYCK